MAGETSGSDDSRVIVLGGGCFWCTEAVFSLVKGVRDVRPGYSGGTTQNPSYEEVYTDKTGHAEVLRVEYRPEEVSLNKLLEIFFEMHDPTQGNRQGHDVGSQYRSVIFYTSDDQFRVVEDYMKQVQPRLKKPLTTEVKLLVAFYPAEDYHRKYYEAHPGQAYCSSVISPKVAKIRGEFRDVLK